jgi:hypothetical protein
MKKVNMISPSKLLKLKLMTRSKSTTTMSQMLAESKKEKVSKDKGGE